MAVPGEIWGYGIAAVAIISVVSLVGMIGLRYLNNTKTWYYLSEFLLAIGAATLFCDAFLHLLPQGLGLHDHSHEEVNKTAPLFSNPHDHDHEHSTLSVERLSNYQPQTQNLKHSDEEEAEHMTMALNFSLAILGFYVLWIVDLTLKNLGHGHSHGMDGHGHSHHLVENTEEKEEEPEEEEFDGSFFQKLKTGTGKALPIFIGDCMHNFIDGIVIAGAFSTSTSLGIGTSIAILFHEIPHELGDFAVYLKLTKSWAVAMILNITAACICFIGLVIGFLVSNIDGADRILVLLTAGMFVYVACIQILPEIDLVYKNEQKKKDFWWKFGFANLGFVLGWTIMFLLAIFEEDIAAWFEAE